MACTGCEINYFQAIEWQDSEIVDFYVKHGIINDVCLCKRCGNRVILNRKVLTFQCYCRVSIRKQKAKQCNWRGSCRAGSFINNVHLPLRKCWRLVNHFLCHDPPRQPFLKQSLKVGDHTIVDWFSFIREVYAEEVSATSERLGGPGKVVEIDEAKFGTRKYNRGRRVKGNWVLGGVERGTNKTFLIPVKDRKEQTLARLIKRWVVPGTTIITDCWKAYNRLNSYRYNHLTVNHSETYVDTVTGAHTNTVERAWRDVRSGVPKYGVRSKHFAGYLAEYLFKRRYTKVEDRHHRFFTRASDMYRPKF
jgi:transposase-like protein